MPPSSFFRDFPARAGFWLLLLLMLALYIFVDPPPSPTTGEPVPASGLLTLVRTLLQMGFFVLLSALALALASTTAAWVRFRHAASHKAQQLEVALLNETGTRHTFRIVRTGAFWPFWGAAQTTLSFSDGETTHPVALRLQRTFSWGKESRQTATGNLELRHIKEYRLQAVRFWFRDAFGLFALPVTVPASEVFLRTPEALPGNRLRVPPRRATEMTERVDTLQRVEGDLYNSRRFATGDDMRRILWSVYARNRELMVRIPEIFEPYASVLTIWAAFNARFPAALRPTGAAGQTALDFYKSAVWTLYQNLAKEGQALHFRMAQGTDFSGSGPVRNAIAAARWDAEEPDPDARAQVWIVSSLTPPETLRKMLQSVSGKRSVVLVRLSEAFDQKTQGNLLTRLLFRDRRDDPQARLRRVDNRLLAAHLRAQEAKLVATLQDADSLTALWPEQVA